MKCSNHSKKDAVGACVTCGRLFCEDCLIKVGRKQHCKECVADNLKETETDSGDSVLHKVKAGGVVITQQVTQTSGKSSENISESPSPKTKTASVLLAIFLSFWTWVYTYRRDYWKFWIGLVLTFIGFIVLTQGESWALIFYFGVWIWAIVDSSLKDKAFYDNYYK